MESFVTRHEFENALKEVQRLQVFLADTFGSKFMEFFKEDKFSEIDMQLKKKLGNWTINLPPKPGPPLKPPSSGVVIPVENINKKVEKLKSTVPISPPSRPPNSLVPIIINTTSVRTATPPLPPPSENKELDIIPVVDLNVLPTKNKEKSVQKPFIPPIKQPTNSNRSPLPTLLPNSILPTLSSSPPPPLQASLGPSKNSTSTNALTITECITLDDEDENNEKKPSLSTTTKENPSPISHRGYIDINRRKPGESVSSSFVDQSSTKVPSTSAALNTPVLTTKGIVGKVNPWPSSSSTFPKRRAVSINGGSDKVAVVDSHSNPSFSNPVTASTNEYPSPGRSTSPNLISGDEIIQCEDCELYIFSSQMEKHLMTHEGNTDGGSDGKSNANVSSSSSTYTSSTISILDQPLSCPLCFKEYPNFQFYDAHCLEFHKEGKPCPICKKLMSRRSTLKRHMSCHEDRKFICGTCGKGYNRKDNLSAHQKIHKDGKEPPTAFYCIYCKCAFASKEGRDKHMSTLHCYNGTGEEESNSEDHWNLAQSPSNGGNGNMDDVISTRDLIDIGPAFKVDVSLDCGNSFQFEYEGDDDDEDLC
ncbi:unnamed protein product [Orchesella dallaii]|uniref:C2H2-type domain-containing protein n=1 Tax=Orchesella dallaii TaxID=48710 RepID=A0ABP1RMH9_9HEXA